jgi:hypothetical protein
MPRRRSIARESGRRKRVIVTTELRDVPGAAKKSIRFLPFAVSVEELTVYQDGLEKCCSVYYI